MLDPRQGLRWRKALHTTHRKDPSPQGLMLVPANSRLSREATSIQVPSKPLLALQQDIQCTDGAGLRCWT